MPRMLNSQRTLTTEDTEKTENRQGSKSRPLRPKARAQANQLLAPQVHGGSTLTSVCRFLPNNIGNVLRWDRLFDVVIGREGFRGLQSAVDRALWKILE